MDEHLLGIIEAIEMMLADFEPVEPMMVSIDRAIGLILAKDLIANIDLPWFTDSSMDGFAVKAEDICTANRAHTDRIAGSGRYSCWYIL